MTLLKEILEVTIYKLLRVKNAMANALAKLTKELEYLSDEPLLIEVCNFHLLAYIDIELVNSCTLKDEIASIE